ncbi:hypothetical protein BOW38_12365 [Solemya velum gill symbiont]|nr:hypothetical protein BOW38_12365 [Solemya velum gill symbiont]
MIGSQYVSDPERWRVFYEDLLGGKIDTKQYRPNQKGGRRRPYVIPVSRMGILTLLFKNLKRAQHHREFSVSHQRENGTLTVRLPPRKAKHQKPRNRRFRHEYRTENA